MDEGDQRVAAATTTATNVAISTTATSTATNIATNAATATGSTDSTITHAAANRITPTTTDKIKVLSEWVHGGPSAVSRGDTPDKLKAMHAWMPFVIQASVSYHDWGEGEGEGESKNGG